MHCNFYVRLALLPTRLDPLDLQLKWGSKTVWTLFPIPAYFPSWSWWDSQHTCISPVPGNIRCTARRCLLGFIWPSHPCSRFDSSWRRRLLPARRGCLRSRGERNLWKLSRSDCMLRSLRGSLLLDVAVVVWPWDWCRCIACSSRFVCRWSRRWRVRAPTRRPCLLLRTGCRQKRPRALSRRPGKSRARSTEPLTF